MAEITEAQRACKECRYWTQDTPIRGRCRRFPPFAVPRLTSAPDIAWPVTFVSDWCGEFAQRAALPAGEIAPKKGEG